MIFNTGFYGIYNGNGNGNSYYYNSVLNPATATSAFFSGSSSNTTVKDNIFYQQGTGMRYAYFVLGAIGTSNYNDLYAPDAMYLGKYNSTNCATLAAWRTATGQDANSISANPNFASVTAPINLHFNLPSPVDSAGTPIAGISMDYDGDLRNPTHPDIGADEVRSGPAPFSLLSPADASWTSDNTPTFSWQAPDTLLGTAADHYELWVEDTLFVGGIATESVTILTPLADGGNHWYVKAYDLAGNQSRSIETWILQVDATPPEAFDLVAPVDSAVTVFPNVDFQWNQSFDLTSGLKKYRLVLNDSVWVDSIAVTDTLSRTPVHYAMSNLSNGAYDWRVEALDQLDNVRLSTQTWHLTVQVVPGVVTDLTIVPSRTPVDSTSITLIWSPTVNAQQYHIYKSTSPSTGFVLIGSTPDTTYVDLDAIVGQTMSFYRVTADSGPLDAPNAGIQPPGGIGARTQERSFSRRHATP